MRAVILLVVTLVAGCTSDIEDAQNVCAGMRWEQQCVANYVTDAQNRRAAALTFLGAALSNYGAPAQPAYVVPTHTICNRFANTVQCTTY